MNKSVLTLYSELFEILNIFRRNDFRFLYSNSNVIEIFRFIEVKNIKFFAGIQTEKNIAKKSSVRWPLQVNPWINKKDVTFPKESEQLSIIRENLTINIY